MFFQFQSIWKSVTLVQYLVLQEHKFGILVLLRYCAHCSSSCWDALAFTRCSVLTFLASSGYLPTFSFSFMMTRWSLGMETSTIYHNLASFSLWFLYLVCCVWPFHQFSHLKESWHFWLFSYICWYYCLLQSIPYFLQSSFWTLLPAVSCLILYGHFARLSQPVARVCSLVVSDLQSETNSYVQRWALCSNCSVNASLRHSSGWSR